MTIWIIQSHTTCTCACSGQCWRRPPNQQCRQDAAPGAELWLRRAQQREPTLQRPRPIRWPGLEGVDNDQRGLQGAEISVSSTITTSCRWLAVCR
jgi:hypothetical protein